MSKYDPNKKEWWTVGSSGFWRKGEVNCDEFMIEVFCTWEEVKSIHNQFCATDKRRYEIIENLTKIFWQEWEAQRKYYTERYTDGRIQS